MRWNLLWAVWRNQIKDGKYVSTNSGDELCGDFLHIYCILKLVVQTIAASMSIQFMYLRFLFENLTLCCRRFICVPNPSSQHWFLQDSHLFKDNILANTTKILSSSNVFDLNGSSAGSWNNDTVENLKKYRYIKVWIVGTLRCVKVINRNYPKKNIVISRTYCSINSSDSFWACNTNQMRH
jgi:hypothetical protein